MKKALIFSESYDEIKLCLFIAKSKLSKGYKVTIIVCLNEDLHTFFKEVNEKVFKSRLNLIIFKFINDEKYSGGIIGEFFQRIIKVIGKKKSLKTFHQKYFSTVRNSEVYFFTRYCNPYDYYFLNRLYKRNSLILINVFDFSENISTYTPKSIRVFLRYCILKFIYGFNMSFIRLPHGNFEYIPDKFIQTSVKTLISADEGERWLNDFNLNEFNVFKTGNFKVIYFDQPLVEAKRVEKDEFDSKLKEIFNIILKYFPESDVGIKYHPMWQSDKSIISAGQEIEDFIPGELLCNDRVNVYIGFSSGAIARIEKGLVVSLIDLMTFKDKGAKEFIKARLLRRARSKIMFPKTTSEFERILQNIPF
jgi:hypothetical protein